MGMPPGSKVRCCSLRIDPFPSQLVENPVPLLGPVSWHMSGHRCLFHHYLAVSQAGHPHISVAIGDVSPEYVRGWICPFRGSSVFLTADTCEAGGCFHRGSTLV